MVRRKTIDCGELVIDPLAQFGGRTLNEALHRLGLARRFPARLLSCDFQGGKS
jgi:hypothetical protein